MSSQLWAIEAARKKKPDHVPGLSRHITAEMKINLETANEGVQTLSLQLLACVLGLNGLIESINNGDKELLLDQIQALSLIKEEVDDTLRDSTTERLSRNLTTDRSSEEAEWKLERSEAVLSRAVKDQSNSDVASVVAPQLSSPKLEEASSPVPQKAVDPIIAAPIVPLEAPKTEEPIKLPKTEETVSMALSPVHIPRTAVPDTSPNVNLSFIPIANSTNPQKFEQNVKTESPKSEDYSDSSFQAISTAIRKSFAGKLSMGHFSGSLPLNTDTEKFRKKLLLRSEEDVPLNTSSNGSRQTLNAPRKSLYQNKRSSVFVSLPSREPITFLSNRQSKIKTEEVLKLSNIKPETVPKQARVPKQERNGNTGNQALKAKAESRKPPVPEVDISRNLRLRLTEQAALPAQISRPENSKGSSSRLASHISAASNSLSPSKMSSPLYKASQRARIQLANKAVNRTSISGSPRREIFTPSVFNSGSARISRSRSRSPVRTDGLSSKNSSRSPTKYSHRADFESTKGSPTNYSDIVLDKEPGLLQRLTLPTSASAAKGSKTPGVKDTVLRNKFLTTTLNPEKPPKFNPLKAQVKYPSPIKKAGKEENEKLRQSRVLHQVAQFDGHQRTKQKITISLSHKLDLKANQHSPPKSRPPNSPKKKEKLPLRDKSTAEEPFKKKSRKTVELADVNVAPRKRAIGNAVPLPEAARGKFTREKPREVTRKKELTTPSRPGRVSRASKSIIALGNSASPGMNPEALPDIPSDDEALKNKKYMKSWAETPELLRVMREKQMDPVAVFGEVPILRIDEVFESLASRQRGRSSPGRTP